MPVPCVAHFKSLLISSQISLRALELTGPHSDICRHIGHRYPFARLIVGCLVQFSHSVCPHVVKLRMKSAKYCFEHRDAPYDLSVLSKQIAHVAFSRVFCAFGETQSL